jgi:hypothetical protein
MAEKKAFLLRLDPEVYDALQRWASDEFRSVNGQIEYLLARAVRESGRQRRPRPADPGDDSTTTR